jgi:multisubunit Na+/H+ antiporter MnhF subunit
MTGTTLLMLATLGLAAATALVAPRLNRAATLADRVALLQLLGAKAVAGCIAIAAAFDEPALADAGLALALLGAVAAAVFAQGGRA